MASLSCFGLTRLLVKRADVCWLRTARWGLIRQLIHGAAAGADEFTKQRSLYTLWTSSPWSRRCTSVIAAILFC